MNSRAFTLVELLIVVGIMGLLATIGVAAYSNAKTNGRNMQRKANLTQIGKALEMYANDHGGLYPSTGTAWYGETTRYGSHTTTGASGYIPNLAPDYLPTLPHDPATNTVNPNSTNNNCKTDPLNSTYVYKSNGNDYKVMAFCTTEGTVSASDPFYDSVYPYSYAIKTAGGAAW